jgi:SAM-dependent methyltransferase
MAETDDYALGRSDAETRRLILQHQIYGPATRRLFQAAGIGRGMSVLDIGSGAGDVALLLADLVGPGGRVTGVDMNAAILETARSRAAAAGWSNVDFRAGAVEELAVGERFDAVVGRWVLMYVPDPVVLLRRLAGLLRPGGIVAFAEMDLAYPMRTLPPVPAAAELSAWIEPPEDWPGPPDVRIGGKLFGLFVEAGLPAPELMLEVPLGGGPGWPGYGYVGETLRSLRPMLVKEAPPGATVPDPDEIAARLRREVVAARGVQSLNALLGAWTRRQ